LGVAVVPVHTLLAVAASAELSNAADVLVANDARMGELYWARCVRADATWRLQGAARVDAPAAAAAAWSLELGAAPASTLTLCGNAWDAHRATLAASLPAGWAPALAAARTVAPSAAAVAALARAAHARGEALPAAMAQPVYVRNKVALTTVEREALAEVGAQRRGLI
jgi:tRNA threonylcarbamoyladenosine biosynthesis protein TsaB